MTRGASILAFAVALAAAAVLASPPIALAAKGGFKGGFKPMPFRAHGLFRPVTPRTFSHQGRPKFHGRHFHRSTHAAWPFIAGRSGGSLALLDPHPSADLPPDEAPVQPALVPVGGAVGCATEEVAVPGGTVGIIRC